ncbi:MAG TPA: hypothetical protein H9694_04755 [Firmicutes bacterium]|nr:hypothetical protein [Bacillota bacterium]
MLNEKESLCLQYGSGILPALFCGFTATAGTPLDAPLSADNSDWYRFTDGVKTAAISVPYCGTNEVEIGDPSLAEAEEPGITPLLNIKMDSLNGQSGGPITYPYGNNATCFVGIHSYSGGALDSHNYGVAFNQKAIDYIQKFAKG